MEKRYGKSQLDFERYAVLAVSSIYGIDILEDNVRQCRERLYDIFDRADPDRAALEQLLEHHYVPSATAYKYLARAERLGVVEHRGRGLFPARR